MRRVRGKGKGRRELIAVAMAAVALAAASPNVANAANDIFVKIGDIKGESVDAKHKNEIEVLSWSWGVIGAFRNSAKQPQQPVGPGQPACAQDISIVKFVDSASPLLFAKAVTGATIPTATFALRKSEASQDFLVITLSDLIVTSVSQGGSQGGDLPTESLTFGFSSGTIAVKQQTIEGAAGESITAPVPGSCR
jgi:type VI secretion system secreted protein Hcp